VFEIGNSLREARLRQGLDFPEIEQATKIRGKYLRALEEEQFDVLPAQTYVKGFLRSYADYLGLDGQLYVDEFNSRYVRGEFEDEEEQAYRPRISGAGRGGGFQGKAVLLTVAVIAGLTVFFFVAWMWGGNGSQEGLPLNPPPPAKPKQPKPTARLVASGVAGGSYIVVRRGSRTSKPIYSGTLENGKKQRFEGRRLWIYVYAPANLRLRLNGRARVVPGAGTGVRRWLLVRPRGVSLATSIG
jgi:cytoskeleton protein RodZ